MNKNLCEKAFLLLLVIGTALSFTGCDNAGDDDNGEQNVISHDWYSGDFRNNRNGTVEVFNNSQYDMLLFVASITGINQNNIVGGVRSGTANTVNFSTQSDYQDGGYVILRAVKQSEFDTHKEEAEVDWAAMVVYGEGRRFTVNIRSTTDGDYEYTVSNMSSSFHLELRKNSPEGEIVVFLSRGEVRRRIRSSDNTEISLYPVWLAWNNLTRSVIAYSPEDQAQTVVPALPADNTTGHYFRLPEQE